VRTNRVPPQAYFVGSAVFHYLGPAFAVLLFPSVGPLGAAWLRIASAAAIFAGWRRPWRSSGAAAARWTVVGLGVVLAVMNTVFYLAIARLPLATVGAIEFLGPVALAAYGLRGRRNLAALVLAFAGVVLLTDVRLTAEPFGMAMAFANCALFVLYVVLGKRIASSGAGIDRLGLSMLVAAVAVTPLGLADAVPAFGTPRLLGAGLAVGVCSSVLPYVLDQLALARLSRAGFALMLSLLPATATIIGLLVLRQVPEPAELAGIALVIAGVAIHHDREEHA
jgi:inner membrane transporter RhtA